MKRKPLFLLVDALIDLALGALLAFFPHCLVTVLGIPSAEPAFYPSILGAVLFGIGVALLIERNRGGGLGLAGAIAISLSGGVALGLWLLFGSLHLPLRGELVLWGLVVLLVVLSTIEMLAQGSKQRG